MIAYGLFISPGGTLSPDLGIYKPGVGLFSGLSILVWLVLTVWPHKNIKWWRLPKLKDIQHNRRGTDVKPKQYRGAGYHA